MIPSPPQASVLMQRLSYPTETVLSNKITRNRKVLSFRQSQKTIRTATSPPPPLYPQSMGLSVSGVSYVSRLVGMSMGTVEASVPSPPASSRRTDTCGSSDSLAAMTAPAAPLPTTMKSNGLSGTGVFS